MGRDKRNEQRFEHFTKLTRNMMETDAWRELSICAQALYPWIKLEWHGPNNNNNGKIRLSVRQAASRLGVSINTAARAFHDLQAKGFIVITEHAHLGVSGSATSPAFELTEIPISHVKRHEGRKLYRHWKKGADYPVHKANVHNPHGRRNKRSPVIEMMTARHRIGDR